MTKLKSFKYSVYPDNYGEGVSFQDGKILFGDYDRMYAMPKEEVKKMYEVMRNFYEKE